MSGDSINLGIFAYDINPDITEVRSAFVSDYEHIEEITHDPILRGIMDYQFSKIKNKRDLKEFVDTCYGPTSIQFTDPKLGISSPDELVLWAAKRFLTY